MVQITVDDAAVRAKFAAMSQKVHASMLREVTKQALGLEAYIKRDKLLGQVLNRVTGALGRSIHSDVQDAPDAIVGRVFSAGVPYAGVHEFGAVFTRLVTTAWGRAVKDPQDATFHYPERSYMRTGLADRRGAIIAGLKRAQLEGTR